MDEQLTPNTPLSYLIDTSCSSWRLTGLIPILNIFGAFLLALYSISFLFFAGFINYFTLALAIAAFVINIGLLKRRESYRIAYLVLGLIFLLFSFVMLGMANPSGQSGFAGAAVAMVFNGAWPLFLALTLWHVFALIFYTRRVVRMYFTGPPTGAVNYTERGTDSSPFQEAHDLMEK